MGCTVTERVGPLVFVRHNSTQRSRAVFQGTVVDTIPINLWRVYWHDVQRTANHKPKELKFISKRKPTCSDEQVKILSTSEPYIGDKLDFTSYFDSNLPYDDVTGHATNTSCSIAFLPLLVLQFHPWPHQLSIL